jgi:hypothetical protein
MAAAQRIITSSNLGRNQTRNHDALYAAVERRYGPTKTCKGVGCIKHEHTVTKKEENEELSIHNFDLHKTMGLQGRCRVCEKKYRRWRTNKSKEKHSKGDVYNNYKYEYGKSTKRCSRCKNEKDIIEFNKSVGMECGLHNTCKHCSAAYGESTGERWLLYLPDGNFKYDKPEGEWHDDHIMPLAVGGSNEINNHQLLPGPENLAKSDSIPYEHVYDIPENQLCDKWLPILRDSKEKGHSIKKFECKVREAIYMEQTERYNMSDEEHIELLNAYNKKNNTRKSVERAHKKFKKFYETRNLNK